MTEHCNFCQGAVDEINKRLDFVNWKDTRDSLCEIVESYGVMFHCGDDRLICDVLIDLMEKYHE
jgi:hypothetical protein